MIVRDRAVPLMAHACILVCMYIYGYIIGNFRVLEQSEMTSRAIGEADDIRIIILCL